MDLCYQAFICFLYILFLFLAIQAVQPLCNKLINHSQAIHVSLLLIHYVMSTYFQMVFFHSMVNNM